MNIALDIVTAVLLISFFAGGYKRGIINMLLSLASSIAAFVVACFVAFYLAEPFYNLVFKETIIKEISNALLTGTDKEAFHNSLPSFLSLMIEKIDLPNSILSGASSEAATLIESAVSPVIQMLISCIFLLISFILISLLLKPVQKLLNSIFKLPVIGFINKLLGGVLGLTEGAFFLIVAVAVMRIWMPYSTSLQEILTSDNINLSMLFSQIYNNGITNNICDFFTQFKFSGGINLA